MGTNWNFSVYSEDDSLRKRVLYLAESYGVSISTMASYMMKQWINEHNGNELKQVELVRSINAKLQLKKLRHILRHSETKLKTMQKQLELFMNECEKEEDNDAL